MRTRTVRGYANTTVQVGWVSSLSATAIFLWVASGMAFAEENKLTFVEPGGEAKAQTVKVFRGVEVGASTTATEPTEAEILSYEPVTGGSGWFVDRENNRIGNCYTVASTQWRGKPRIRCVWKSMP